MLKKLRVEKYLFLCLIGIFILVNGAKSQGIFYNELDKFLGKYVRKGKVDYTSMKENQGELNNLLQQISSTKIDSLEIEDQKAFLINSYNLLVIKSVLEGYPVNSPMGIQGFFDVNKHDVDGGSYTLNQLEKQRLVKAFEDPRFHFVLVCGAVDCPPLVSFAYRGEMLEEQLELQTKKALNDSVFVRIDSVQEKYSISEIFKWYEKEFTKDSPSVLAYINKYRENPIPKHYGMSFYTYDWTLNDKKPQVVEFGKKLEKVDVLSTFTPSVLLSLYQKEIKIFNSIYTQTAYRNFSAQLQHLDRRESFYTGFFQFTMGISANNKINAGIDIIPKAVYYDPNKKGNPLEVLNPSNPDSLARQAITTMGPRIKIAPFNKMPRFSIQSAFWVPVAGNLENTPWLDHDKYTWFTQLFYDKTLGDKWQIFLEQDVLWRMKRNNEQKGDVTFPSSFFMSFFPNRNSTLYLMVQHAPTTARFLKGNQSTYRRTGSYSQAGIGAKYQISKYLGLEILYTNFFRSQNQGAGHTFNFGVRYLSWR